MTKPFQRCNQVYRVQMGLIFNIQRYSVQDGPGIRSTVFFKGCPLHCAWCHNPESMSHQPEIILIESRCIQCGECRTACPQSDGTPGNSPQPTRAQDCTLCSSCVEACPTQGRQMVGQSFTVQEVLEIVLRDRMFYDDSGGGVTFSGGEPLMQPEFLRRLLECCRKEGLHTAVDTSGFTQTDRLLEIAPFTSLFLYDLKLMDDAEHQHHTGVSNRQILENLQALGRRQSPIWLRVPVIPGINDSPSQLTAIARFATTVPGIRQVNLLPYHKTGLQKRQRLGKTNPLPDVQPPSPESMAQALQIFQNAGLNAKTGG